MYLNNKYTRWYHAIISAAKVRTLSSNVYSEKHHITPKSLGGDNSTENLAILTAREHYICHRLLTKMVTGESRKKMVYAFWRMSNMLSETTGPIRITSHTYEVARRAFALEKAKDVPDSFKYHNRGRKFSEEHKRKISESAKRVNAQRRDSGVKMSAAGKANIAAAMADQAVKAKIYTPERNTKMAAAKTGKKRKYLPDGSFIMVNPDQL